MSRGFCPLNDIIDMNVKLVVVFIEKQKQIAAISFLVYVSEDCNGDVKFNKIEIFLLGQNKAMNFSRKKST